MDHYAYINLQREWVRYEDSLKHSRKEIEQFSYSPFIESENVNVVPQSWEKETPFVTKLFLLPREFALISPSTLLLPIEIPALPALPERPPITLDKSKYPEWYLTPNKSTLFEERSSYENDIHRRQKIVDESVELQKLIDEKRKRFELVLVDAGKEHSKIQGGLINGDIRAIERLILISHQKHPLPAFLRREYRVAIDPDSQIALIEFKFPDYSNEELLIDYTGINHDKRKFASATQAKKYVKQCLYSLIIRSGYLSANLCVKNAFKSVVVNVEQDWNDPATGTPRSGLIASLQAPADYLRSLDLTKLDPEACFKHLKGIATPSLQNVSPIRAIFVLNKEDNRFVSGQEIDGQLESEANLAAIPWEDFEHLVAQLFEWEFQRKGIEVRVTRASRDRGVDAILFDPDPLRGGKYVLQAKRYTRTVDVSAVRDLYGTLMNEGANRGILITTSSYGQDAYEFVKDKPISLVDGPNLILMLQKHGKKYRIDLEEARRLNVE
jgi:restriction system protein